jgi:iron complex outermembrane receptor protein
MPRFATLILLLVAAPALAQNGTLTGLVTDVESGEPLIGANVALADLNIGTATDTEGRYRFEAPPGTHTLVASFVGYRAQEVTVRVEAGETIERDFALLEDLVGAGEVVVVGTRGAGRTVVDSPVPVDVISPADLASTGQIETSQILSVLVPSYNAPQASITDGSDHVRPATLRGLGPDQVLVLVNGKRRHTSALVHVNGSVGRGSTGIDLNAIPASAIERIEVLRDGAAAQYGSDAIAGVINIILKDRVGFDASVNLGQYVSTVERGYGSDELFLPDGSDREDYDFDAPGETGFELIGPPEEVTYTDGQTIEGHLGYGIPVADGGSVYVSAQGRHRGFVNRAGLDPRQQFYDGFDGTVSEEGFDRENHRYGNGEFDEASVFANAIVPLSGAQLEAYASGGASYREGLTGCFYRRSLDDRTNRSLYPDGFLPKINAKVRDASASAGLRGSFGEWAFDLSETVGTNAFNFDIADSHNASMDNGPTDFDAGTLGFAQATTNLDVFRSLNVGTSSPLSVAVGAEFRYENYSIDAGEEASYLDGGVPVRDGPNAGGSTAPGSQCFPGFQPQSQQDESRTNLGVYVDLENNVTERWLVGVAGRFETYSDFGTTVTGKLSTRLELVEGFALRGAAATGFRAPSLAQAWFTSIATNFIDGVPFEVGTFPVESDVARALGAADLDPEKSRNLSAGVTFNRADVSVTVDGYLIEIDDRITFTENFTSDAVAAFLQDRGINASGGRYFTNAVDTRTLGLDVIGRYGRALGPGTARFTAALNVNDTEVTNTNDDGVIPAPAELRALDQPALVDRVRVGDFEVAQPDSKLLLQANYELSAWSFLVRTNRYGEVTSRAASDPLRDQTFGAEWLTDLEVAYVVRDGVRLAVGANNVFDVYPEKQLKRNSFNGIFPYNGFSPFGFFGRFVYTRVNVRL